MRGAPASNSLRKAERTLRYEKNEKTLSLSGLRAFRVGRAELPARTYQHFHKESVKTLGLLLNQKFMAAEQSDGCR